MRASKCPWRSARSLSREVGWPMTRSTKKPSPSWTEVKASLADFDRVGLIGLVHDLYMSSKDNQAFLHARFAVGGDVLKPYKATC